MANIVRNSRTSSYLGCPRNKFFFRFEPKLDLFRLFFGLFRETKQIFFRFVSVFRTGIETTETNRTNIPKTNLYYCVLETMNFIFGSNRNSTCFGCFSVCFFRETKQNFFSVCFGPVSKQPKQTELMVWGNKKVYILTNWLLFRLVFSFLRLF